MKEQKLTKADVTVVVMLVLFLLVLVPCCTQLRKSGLGCWKYDMERVGCGQGMRAYSTTLQCEYQLAMIGQGLSWYQCDYEDQYPVLWARGVEGTFGMGLYNRPGETEITRWANPTFDDWSSQPTVGGCLYLLTRYEQVDARAFVCPGAPEDEEMELEEAKQVATQNGWEVRRFEDLRDFQSMRNLSYSYADPWATPLDASIMMRFAVVADKSWPYDTETGVPNEQAGDFPVENPDNTWNNARGRNLRHGNSRNHGTKWQNVLFADAHVSKCSVPTVAWPYGEDNIYTYWAGGKTSTWSEKRHGRWDQGHAVAYSDAYLGN